MERHPLLLDRHRSGLIVIDIQEKILKVMAEPDKVVENTRKLIRGAAVLEIPVFITEQYPEGLGRTVPAVLELLPDASVREKLTFSSCGLEGLVDDLRDRNIDQVILCGIESHVCIWQTAMDLLHKGLAVYLVIDGTSSRKYWDMHTALLRMSAEGVRLCTTEMVLFELLEKAGSPMFREISRIIR